MDTLETRELRYFVAVAEELHFGRAAERLGMAQPPLSRAIQRLERRLGVTLFERDRRGVALTASGQVLLREGRTALDAVTAAARRTRRAAAGPGERLVLVAKAGTANDVLSGLLAAHAAEPGAAEVEVVLCGIGEQPRYLRDGRADVALMHRPYDDLSGFDGQDLLTEGQVAVLPPGHPLAARDRLTMDDVRDVPGLPLARWPRPDGSYPPGPGPEVREQAQLAQLVALGRVLVVTPGSAYALLWRGYACVPVVDAPLVTTLLAWPSHSRSLALARLARVAARLQEAG
ncbi:LysR family transcriptional regulator [Nonomuraea sp. NPDC049421]|uniref:LysR family transcriptional regulator n=1 Tax=Nonomuraea sp. NPDC049421 TaxID=3155275 RepID=UPI00343526DC